MSRLYAAPLIGELLRNSYERYADRTAFAWDGGSISYRGVGDWCARAQAVMLGAGCSRGTRMAFLAANRWDAWAANSSALSAGMSVTMLHPLASLEDHLFQLRDFGAQVLVVDTNGFGERAAALVAAYKGLKHVYTLGAASFGTDLHAAAERIGEATLQCIAQPEDIALV